VAKDEHRAGRVHPDGFIKPSQGRFMKEFQSHTVIDLHVVGLRAHVVCRLARQFSAGVRGQRPPGACLVRCSVATGLEDEVANTLVACQTRFRGGNEFPRMTGA
jgi:hypothetical protein